MNRSTKCTGWWELYQAALLETDHTRMQARIEAAVAAIRFQMEQTGIGASRENERGLLDALQNLRTLEKMESRESSRPVADSRSSIYGGG